jgi:DNA-directed RNA polymerase specialized sigma24 family protein
MEENYISDGGMLRSKAQDTRFANHYSYILDNVFIENKPEDLREKTSETSKRESLENYMAMVLNNLPTAMREVFELYTNQYLELNEISKIYNSTTEKVKELLNKARKALKVSSFNRYYC